MERTQTRLDTQRDIPPQVTLFSLFNLTNIHPAVISSFHLLFSSFSLILCSSHFVCHIIILCYRPLFPFFLLFSCFVPFSLSRLECITCWVSRSYCEMPIGANIYLSFVRYMISLFCLFRTITRTIS